MPQMANISIVDAAAKTIDFVKLQPASGDETNAVWRYLSTGKPVNTAETLTVNTRWNGPKTVRRVTGNYELPLFVTDVATGKVTRTDSFKFSFTGGVLQNASILDAAMAVDHFTLLLRAALLQEILSGGYNAT